MTRHVTEVVASLSAFMLAQIAHETVEAGLAQEHATARAAPTLSGHELASQASSAPITTLVALADERAAQVKSDSLPTFSNVKAIESSSAEIAAASLYAGRTTVT